MTGYQRKWLRRDLIAGSVLAAVAIPEVMGYTVISKTPIVTGLYTLILPVIIFAAIGASRFLAVGADSALAAVFAAGLGGAAITGVTPGSAQWLAYTSIIALLCGALLALAAIFRLGFLADFISTPINIGVLAGVGLTILVSQIPQMLGVPTVQGSWLEKQWALVNSLGALNWRDLAYALGALLVILGFSRFQPKIPGALVAIVLFTGAAFILDSAASGVEVVGAVQGGLPPFGLPAGVGLVDIREHAATLLLISVSCFVLILAESGVTGRYYATKHGDRVNLNRDMVALAGSNVAAGLSGTFAVGGSMSKTEIMESNGGRSQVANLVMAAICVMVLLFLTPALASMPKAVLSAVVFLIACRLIKVKELRQVFLKSKVEFVAAVNTAIVICLFGAATGIGVAIVVSVLHVMKLQYTAKSYVLGLNSPARPTYTRTRAGIQSEPGLIVFQHDGPVLYSNVNRFVDEVSSLVDAAPNQVRWFILDLTSFHNIDYTTGLGLDRLFKLLKSQGITIALLHSDPQIATALSRCGLDKYVPVDRNFIDLSDAYSAYRSDGGNP